MIPIQNLYYLLLYAWDALPPGGVSNADRLPQTDILNLLAAVLNRGADQLLRRGLDRGYRHHVEAIPGIRGKLDLSATLKGGHLRRLRTVCEFDELTADVLHNQILKSTARRLLRTDGLDTNLLRPVRVTLDRLVGVSEIPLTARSFGSVQLHRNVRQYRLLLDVCRLIHECLIPHEQRGRFRFEDFTRDEHKMTLLFERFVRNFYRRHLPAWKVKRDRFKWDPIEGSPEDLALLPRMETDITLIRSGRRFIIDTKFSLTSLQRFRDKESLRSGHLYQLFAYLQNLSSIHGPEAKIDGMLLYPEIDRRLDVHYQLHGHHVFIKTINLNQEWREIHADLLHLVESD